MNVVLVEPEIPQNTGSVGRLCAATETPLHLVGPLGFSLEDRYLKRAGLDYHEYATLQEHASLEVFLKTVQPARLFGFSTKGRRNCFDVEYQADDALLFGPETRGLPESVREQLGEQHLLRLPMLPTNRSLNLSNTVAIVVYEAWRQQGFSGAV